MENYNVILESLINGQYSQARSQFNELTHVGQYNFLSELRRDDSISFESRLGYFNYFANHLIERIEELER